MQSLAKRIETLDARVKKDIEVGGPFASREFRHRWKLITSNKRSNEPSVPELDKTFPDDISKSVNITKRRLSGLADLIAAFRERLMRTMVVERSNEEFILSLPAPGRSVLYVSDQGRIEEATRQKGREKFYLSTIQTHLDIINLDKPHYDSPNWNYQVDRTDALIIAVLDRGIVDTAYEAESLGCE